MNIIKKVVDFFFPKEDLEGPIERDEDGHDLYKEDVAARILAELEERRSERRPYELQWELNANFLAGNQNCEINTYVGEVADQPAKYDYEDRAVYNRITPLYETRLAHLQKVNYAMRVNPRTDELDDYKKAEVSTSLLRYWQVKLGFNEMKNKVLSWCELAGTCFLLSGWDSCGGREVARIVRPILTEDKDTSSTTDGVGGPPSGGWALDGDPDASVASDGDTSSGEGLVEEYPVYEGEITCDSLSPYEVFPEDVNRESVAEQHSIILEQVMSVEAIYDQYGIRVDGGEVQTYSLMPTPNSGIGGYENTTFSVGSQSVRNAEKVITFMERPCRRHPDGVLAIIIGDELIHYGALPYGEIPLVAIKSKVIAGKFFGKSVIEELIPLQRAYNACKNKINDYIARLANGNLLVEEGSIDIDELAENGNAPGMPIVFKRGYNPPVPAQMAQIPGQVFAECEQLARDMEYVAGVSQLMVAGAAGGVQSGTAINNLRDIDDTRMSLSAERVRSGVLEVAKCWLSIAKRFCRGYSVLDIVGANDVGNAVVWCAEDINSFDIEYTTENELMYSPEKQKQDFIEAFNMGLFMDDSGKIPQRVKRQMMELQKLGNFGELTAVDDLHAVRARREFTYFSRGVIPKVAQYDDHEIHVDEHMRAVLQRDFELLERSAPEMAKAFLAHIEEHKSAMGPSPEQLAVMAQAMQGDNTSSTTDGVGGPPSPAGEGR